MKTASFVREVVTVTVTESDVVNRMMWRSELNCSGSVIVVSTPEELCRRMLRMWVVALGVATNAPVTSTTLQNFSPAIVSRLSMILRVSVLSIGFVMRVVSGFVLSAGLTGMMMSEPVMCLVKVAMTVLGCPVASESDHAKVHVRVSCVTSCHHVKG